MISKRSHEIDVPSPPGPDELRGRVLDGRYRVVRKLGAGGMGAVYLGEHVALGTKVAIKTLQANLAAQERFRKRFLREARAASSLRSEHVVQITDFGSTDDGIVYFVMEHLEGEDLEVLLKREGPMPWSRARWLFVQILSALRAAHAKQIVHRDIKPANCFVFDDADRGSKDNVKVLDFGLAKVSLEEDPTAQPLTATDEIFGTVAYMAPECTLGKPADARSDLYAVGILMYRALVGELPFRASNSYLILNMQVHAPPPSARLKNPAVPEPVDAIILRALAKDPRDRFQSADAMLAALDEVPPDVPARASASSLAGLAPRMTQMPTRMLVGAGLAGPVTQAASDEVTDQRPMELPLAEGPATVVVTGEAPKIPSAEPVAIDEDEQPPEPERRAGTPARPTLLEGGAGQPVLVNPRRADPAVEGVPAALVTVPSAALPLSPGQSAGSGLYEASAPELALQTMPSIATGLERSSRSRTPMTVAIVVGSVLLFGASLALVAGWLREDGSPSEPQAASAAMVASEPVTVAAPAPVAAAPTAATVPIGAPEATTPTEPAAVATTASEATEAEPTPNVVPRAAAEPEPTAPPSSVSRREGGKTSAAVSSRPSLATEIKKIKKQVQRECPTSGTFEVQARHEEGVPKKGGVTVAGSAPRTVTKCIAGVVERHRLPPSSKPIIKFQLEL